MHFPHFRSAKTRRSRHGTAMIPALLVVGAVAVLSMTYVQLSLTKSREQRASIDTKRAFYMAEAGLSEAFLGLVTGRSGNVGSPALPAVFANGLFFVEAEEKGHGRVALTSTGLCGAGRATLRITVERQSDTFAALGVFADEKLTIEGGCTIDSYDSREGTYESQVLGGHVNRGTRVGCNGDIVAGGRDDETTIYGDARPGPSGTLLRSSLTTITGSTAPNSAVVAFPSIDVPTLPSQGSIHWTHAAPTLKLMPGTHRFDDLRLNGVAKGTIYGPATLVVGRLLVASGGTFEIDARNGPVKVIVTDQLDLEPGSNLSTVSDDPLSASLLVPASETLDRDGDGIDEPPARLAANGTFHGTIYAPGAKLQVEDGFTVYGAIVAERLKVLAGGEVHFDRALAQTSADASGLPRLLGWQLVELPTTPFVSLRYDALRYLRQRGIVPPTSTDAHYDIGDTPP